MKSIFTIIILLLIGFSINTFAQAQFYDESPDATACKEGKLKDAEKQKILNLVNKVRAIHGLKPVTYNYTKDIYVQKSALLSAANEQLNHTPPTNWKCYSSDGATGSENSNLHVGWFYGSTWPTCESSISSWMIDENIDVCGHRRWIIDPFLKFIAFGRVDAASVQNPQFNVTGMSIYVIDADKQNITDWQSDFVAYPYQNYPVNMVYTSSNSTWFFSFTAIFDKTNYWNNQKVSYANATIEIKNEQNQVVPTSEVTNNNEGYGVPNLLKWKIPSVQQEVKYTVTIKNVDLNGTKKDFTYWFKITDLVGNSPAAPTLILPANAAKNVDANQTFTWNPATDADTYIIQIAKDNAFSNIVAEQSDLTSTSFTASSLQGNTLLYWRVAGKNNIGTGAWSEIRSFTTKLMPPVKPLLSEPLDLQYSVSITPALKWDAVSGATSYHVQISENDQFGSLNLILNQENIPSNTFNVPINNLQYNSKYYWRVQAKNTAGYGEYSDNRSFMTIDLSSVDIIDNETKIINVYPNPAQDIVICKVNPSSSASVLQILNESGQLVNSYSLVHSGEQTLSINVSAFLSGTYLLRFLEGSKEIVRKIQIVR